MEEGALRLAPDAHVSICPRWSHEGTPRSETWTSVIHLLPPVCVSWHTELSAKPLIGSGVICILVPWIRFIPWEGDTQLFKQAPGRMVDVEAVQAAKKGMLLRLEVVLKWNPTTGRGEPEGEVKLALPPAEGSGLPELPCLICHCNVSSERRVLIVGEDVREHGLKVTLLIVDHYVLVGQRGPAFSLKWPPVRYFAWLLNENAFVSMSWNHACDTDRPSKRWTGLSRKAPLCSCRWARGCSLWVDILSPVA